MILATIEVGTYVYIHICIYTYTYAHLYISAYVASELGSLFAPVRHVHGSGSKLGPSIGETRSVEYRHHRGSGEVCRIYVDTSIVDAQAPLFLRKPCGAVGFAHHRGPGLFWETRSIGYTYRRAQAILFFGKPGL